MYSSIALVFALVAVAGIASGTRRGSPRTVAFGIAFGLAGLALFGGMTLWTESLWFDALGQARRFWIVLGTRVGMMVLAAVAGWVLVHLLSRQAADGRPQVRHWPAALAAVFAISWGWRHWDTALLFWHGHPLGQSDPVIGRDIAFYLFQLPLYDALQNLLLGFALLGLAANLAAVVVAMRDRVQVGNELVLTQYEPDEFLHRSLLRSAAVLAFVLSWRLYLGRFHLLIAGQGVVSGAGWTDVHIRLPAYALAIGVTVIVGILLCVPAVGQRFQRRLKLEYQSCMAALWTVGGAAACCVGFWLVVLAFVPALVQWLVVEPSEITRERSYLSYSIAHTREAFGLQDVEVRHYSIEGRLDAGVMEDNQDLFDNIRLWDPRALKAVYQQFQEIRLYYRFNDVDIDRYRLNGDYRQVMLAAREMDHSNLPPQSQTFINRHFIYTHGYGAAMSDASKFRSGGLPDMLLEDLPVKSGHPELALRRPQIYYGELTDSYVIVNSREAEFSYPSGDTNMYIHYPGSGGVPLTSVWRRFAFGWRFGGTRLLLSDYPTSESRIMFRRQVRQRVHALAPFLEFDDDPYLVVHDGELHWFVDAYTTSRSYPYSQPLTMRDLAAHEGAPARLGYHSPGLGHLEGINYLRNSVKVVVNAFDGSVRLYVFESEDPVVRAWRAAFPDLFHDREDMPAGLLAHIRYPVDMLRVQGTMYARYHMTEPEVFYNQEDLWVRATEKYYGRVVPVQPYYIMWQPPGAEGVEFVLMLPFTPKRRQLLIGWMAGLCDPDNYGRLIVYKFPKDSRILGPQQVETKIDQDAYLAAQMSLWDQLGSNVIRGNVLAIPVGETLVYIEPMYLRAETAAYPELRLIVAMEGDRMHYAENLTAALAGLYDEVDPLPSIPAAAVDGPDASTAMLVNQVNTAFDNYLDALAERRFQDAGRYLDQLQEGLRSLEQSAGEPVPVIPAPGGRERSPGGPPIGP